MSIVVPAHNASQDLGACLSAIRSSALNVAYELIVVDDASSDDTPTIAENHADKVIRIARPAQGPANARNTGTDSARAEIVAFVDADVVVPPDALQKMLDVFGRTNASAVFGSYDSRPFASGVVSQYRNLLHHFVHQRSAGSVQSFWAGCGAVRKSALQQVGGFDARRFAHAEMEDVELGYRLIDAGHEIVLDPSIQCTHRKRITLASMIRGDFSRRGIPWTRVLLERGEVLKPHGLSLGGTEKLSAIAAAMFALMLVLAIVTRSTGITVSASAALFAFIAANATLFAQLNRLRGFGFALACVPLHLIYTLTAVSALSWGIVTHPFNRSARERYTHLQ
ncbi:MAG TPA: glycosyltransferase [Gemmatimonadaceae bacterium]